MARGLHQRCRSPVPRLPTPRQCGCVHQHDDHRDVRRRRDSRDHSGRLPGPGGRVERYTDPAAANDAAAAASSPNPAWAATNREVLDIETGTTTDITGFAAAPLALPDGPGIRLDRVLEAEPAADGSPGTAAWIGTDDDGGTVRTEDVSAVEVEKQDSAHEHQYRFSLVLRPISVEAP